MDERAGGGAHERQPQGGAGCRSIDGTEALRDILHNAQFAPDGSLDPVTCDRLARALAGEAAGEEAG